MEAGCGLARIVVRLRAADPGEHARDLQRTCRRPAQNLCRSAARRRPCISRRERRIHVQVRRGGRGCRTGLFCCACFLFCMSWPRNHRSSAGRHIKHDEDEAFRFEQLASGGQTSSPASGGEESIPCSTSSASEGKTVARQFGRLKGRGSKVPQSAQERNTSTVRRRTRRGSSGSTTSGKCRCIARLRFRRREMVDIMCWRLMAALERSSGNPAVDGKSHNERHTAPDKKAPAKPPPPPPCPAPREDSAR